MTTHFAATTKRASRSASSVTMTTTAAMDLMNRWNVASGVISSFVWYPVALAKKAVLGEFLFVIIKSNATFFFFLPFSFDKHDQNIDRNDVQARWNFCFHTLLWKRSALLCWKSDCRCWGVVVVGARLCTGCTTSVHLARVYLVANS